MILSEKINPRGGHVCLLALLVAFLFYTPAHAIVFDFTYEAGSSAPPAFEDASGTQLLNIMNAAGALWGDIIEDPLTINVAVRWQVPTIGANFSGQMSLYGNHPNNTNGDPSEQNSRAVWALIRMNPNRTWWVDPTPLNNSEFDMNQTLFRDLTLGQQTGVFSQGTPPDLLEVGFRGAPNASAPALMQAAGTRDLLTVSIHELGHTVGIGGTQAAANEFGTDGTYDIPTSLVNGASFDVNTESLTNSHIHPSSVGGAQVLMCRCSLANVRILPSAIDVFAGATTANWTDIDLQRQDFLGGNDWNTGFNWEGNAPPGFLDDAWVRNGNHISLSANGSANDLEISASSEVTTNANTLSVVNTITVEHDTGGLRPFLRVSAGGEVNANDLNLNGGELLLLGGTVDLDDDLTVRITNGQRGRITGRGTIDIDGDLTNGGTIRPFGGTLTINSNAAFAALNLDGLGGVGIVDATVGDLTINGDLLGSYDGLITVGDDRTVTFNDGWTLGSSGQLILEGGATATDAATIAGPDTTLEGPVEVDGFARISNTTIDGASIDLAANTASGTLILSGPTTYTSGNTLGSGVLRQDGDLTVNGTFSIGNATYDWDGGFASPSDTTITPNGSLSISSGTIDPFDNAHDGTINVNSGSLNVLTAWELDGTLNMTRTSGQTPVLDGIGGVTINTGAQLNTVGTVTINTPVTVDGEVNVGQFGQLTGTTSFNGAVDFNATADVTIESGSTLSINDTANFDDGSYVGNGTLRINGTADIIDDVSWGMMNLDWDGITGTGVTNIGLGRSLSIASNTVEVAANDGFDGTVNVTSGTLSVLPAWRLDGVLNLNQITPQFLRPTLNGTFGLTIHTTGQLNTDGNANINTAVTVNGGVQVTDGTASFNNNIDFNSTASVVVSISSLSVTGSEVLELNGLTTYSGGSYGGNGTIRQVGDATVLTDTTISVGRFDADGEENAPSTLQLNADLTLNVEQIDVPGLTKFSRNRFDGTLSIASGATLTVNTPDPWTFNGGAILGDNGAGPAAIDGSLVNIGNGAVAASIVVHGLGQINAPVAFQADASLSVPVVADRLEVNGPATFSGGTYTGSGTLAIDNDAIILEDTTINTAGLDLDGSTDADHTITINAKKTFTINSNSLDDTSVQFGDMLLLQEDAHLVVNTASRWATSPSGTLRFEGQAIASPTPTLSGQDLANSGLIEGNGTLNVTVTNRNGTIRPGLSAGTLVFDDLAIITGLVEVELGGTKAITEYDQVVVTGRVSLADHLDITLIDDVTPNYLPNYGDTFEILTYGSRNDTFDLITFKGSILALQTDLALAPVYDFPGNSDPLFAATPFAAMPNSLTLFTTLPGDANLDLEVEDADLSLLLSNFGMTDADWIDGDFTGDRIVDDADLSLLLTNFGSIAVFGSSASLAGNAATIPEPASLSVFMLGCLLLARRRAV